MTDDSRTPQIGLWQLAGSPMKVYVSPTHPVWGGTTPVPPALAPTTTDRAHIRAGLLDMARILDDWSADAGGTHEWAMMRRTAMRCRQLADRIKAD